MNRLPKPQSVVKQLVAIASLFLFGCGDLTTLRANSSCPSGTAQIAVYDTGMQRICGCNEGSSGLITSSTGLVCTISVGTVISFNYINIGNSHQIYITGLTTFPTRNPTSGATITDGIQMNSTGSFTFADFYTTIGGTIVVQ